MSHHDTYMGMPFDLERWAYPLHLYGVALYFGCQEKVDTKDLSDCFELLVGWRPSLEVTKGIATRSKKQLVAPGLTTSNEKLLVAKGIATSNKGHDY